MMRNTLIIVLVTGLLCGCSLEVWEGSVYDSGNKDLWTHTYFDKEECERVTRGKLRALEWQGKKPSGTSCTLKDVYGF